MLVANSRMCLVRTERLKWSLSTVIIYSVIETVKGHGLNVYKYLTYLFKHLPNVVFLIKPELLKGFLLWAKNVQEHCKGV